MRIFTCLILFFLGFQLAAQDYISYQNPIQKVAFNPSLGDSVRYEIILPKAQLVSEDIKYPVFYVLDRQNTINYNYVIQTIDYLTSILEIPEVIVVGISLEGRTRSEWTVPNHRKKRAEEFANFLADDLFDQLSVSYPVADFKTIIGHSRTAIFASYALSLRFDRFNAVVGSSTAFFDFGDQVQQQAFESFQSNIKNIPEKNFFYYFSSGSERHGDGHEKSVEKLDQYLKQKKSSLANNFFWQNFSMKGASHNGIPGLTVSHAINRLFDPFSLALMDAQNIVKKQIQRDSVPWSRFNKSYEEASKVLSYNVQPNLTFYNTIASAYFNDYNKSFGDRNTELAIEVLKEGIKHYPMYEGFYTFLADIHQSVGRAKKALKYYEEALTIIDFTDFLDKEEKREMRSALNNEIRKLK